MKCKLPLALIAAVLIGCQAGLDSPPVHADAQDADHPATGPVPPDERPPSTLPAEPQESILPGGCVVDAPDPAIEALLDQLERSAADLQGFTAKITYEKEDTVLGRREARTGELIYRLDTGTAEKSFAVLFDSTIINGRKRSDLKHYIFNGRWLAEIDHANKQFIKREIVPPGKQLDPLKLGEGPFPLPIGQPKAQVLARFTVTRAEPPADKALLSGLENVDGLLLTPKPGTPEAEDFESVRLFYDRETSLPVGIDAIEKNDDRKSIRLSDVKRNPAFDDATLKKLDIQEPTPAKEWRIDVRPWTARE